MKAATGELNLTLITVIALGAILALFTAVVLPAIQQKLTNNWDENETQGQNAQNSLGFVDYIETDLF